jgi:hypothetical protein
MLNEDQRSAAAAGVTNQLVHSRKNTGNINGLFNDSFLKINHEQSFHHVILTASELLRTSFNFLMVGRLAFDLSIS